MKLSELRDTCQDPRADIKHDHNLWIQILLGAKPYPDLYARLHFVRCMGGHIIETETMYQILQGEMTAADWDMVKSRVLQPIIEALIDFFKFCRNWTEVPYDESVDDVARLFGLNKSQLTWEDGSAGHSKKYTG